MFLESTKFENMGKIFGNIKNFAEVRINLERKASKRLKQFEKGFTGHGFHSRPKKI